MTVGCIRSEFHGNWLSHLNLCAEVKSFTKSGSSRFENKQHQSIGGTQWCWWQFLNVGDRIEISKTFCEISPGAYVKRWGMSVTKMAKSFTNISNVSPTDCGTDINPSARSYNFYYSVDPIQWTFFFVYF